MTKSKLIGYWAGKHIRCPKCNSEMLKNGIGDRWCSHITCDYMEIKDE